MDYLDKYKQWLERVDDDTRQQLLDIEHDDVLIQNCFYKNLSFGTAGARGLMGVGTNRLNKYTVASLSQALANYEIRKGHQKAVICYDSRLNSRFFAELAASVLASNGIQVKLASAVAPMPFLSYCILELKADFGIMITASHNPKEYNGYKVSDKFGVQYGEQQSNEIMSIYNTIDCFGIKYQDFKFYLYNQTITHIKDSVFSAYLEAIKKYLKHIDNNINVAYTPLNGAGYQLVPMVLGDLGVKDLVVVKEQAYPDGNFLTCPFPNPENPHAMQLGIQYATDNNSDILLATDPDADRLGVAVRHKGQYKLLTGNEIGVLLCYYLLTTNKNSYNKSPIIIRSIVSTSLVDKLASEFGATVQVVPTGFRYIGQIVTSMVKKGEEDSFVLGFEESSGYLIGTHCRDKDAVVVAMVVTQMADYYKGQGRTLCDVLQSIYNKYGTYTHKLQTYKYDGASGDLKMKRILKDLRDNPIKSFVGIAVLDMVDYLNTPQTLDMIQYNLESDATVIIRPSGTEPLIKVYITLTKDPTTNEKIYQNLLQYFQTIF